MRHCYRDPGGLRACVDLVKIGPARWYVSRVATAAAERGNGGASRALATALRDADDEDVTLVLCVAPDHDDATALSRDVLVDWYARHGFVRNGHTSDMIREPH